MLTRTKKEMTAREALGHQAPGMYVPDLTEQQKKLLHECRMDMHFPEGVGLQWTPDSVYPWFRDDVVKINLGVYRKFSGVDNWINVASDGEKKVDFNIPYGLVRLPEGSVGFIYCPYVLSKLDDPSKFLTMMKAALIHGGVVAIVEEDRDYLIREGRKFEDARFNGAELERLVVDSHMREHAAIDFEQFTLAGGDFANIGFFGLR
jgi:hypothetical protein